VIPAGQYGAGTVMVWDMGTYEPQNGIPPDKQLAQGKIDVEFHGSKLRGGFTLVRTGKRPGESSDKEQWLLIKRRDEYADPSWDIESPRFDRSVLTGRSLSEIANGAPKKTSRRAHAAA
jgi:bifunctional non-homologous end joining protein LigD